MEVQGLTISMMMRCMHENHHLDLATTTVSLRLMFEHAVYEYGMTVWSQYLAFGYEYDSILGLATSDCRMEVQGLSISMMMPCMTNTIAWQ